MTIDLQRRAGAVEQWFSWWLTDWRMEVTLTDVTQALCAVNLAGPEGSCRILAALTDLDVSPEGFGYLDARQGRVAGADALLLRIGFVGELGYEIHFPSAHGEHVWDALLQAGAPHGIRPPRPGAIATLLRLQKQHIIVSQDTDSESTPYGAAMPWAVKLDKRRGLHRQVGAGARRRDPGRGGARVGFTLPDGRVSDGGLGRARRRRPCRRSGDERPPLASAGEVIGMAWVPAGLAATPVPN